MSEEFDWTKVKNRLLLEEVSKRGFFAVKKEISQDVEYKFPRQLEPFNIGIVSDTHIGSIHQQVTYLKHFYKLCEKAKVQKILHCGDLVEGNGKQWRGQMYQMFIHGADAQLRYAAKIYPRARGIKTYVTGGQHDYCFWKSDGTDILEGLAKKRRDIEYLGMFGAYISIGNIKIYMMHGDGGVAYARSYKLQKIIEQIAPENKPHILVMGHFHCPSYIPMYRNVEGFQLSCFQSQTPYMKRKGLYPAIGGIILTIYPNEKGLSSIDICWKHYYEVIENDY